MVNESALIIILKAIIDHSIFNLSNSTSFL